MQAARLQILSALPVPKSIPDEVLNPIIIPPPFSIYDYLAGATGVRFPLILLVQDAHP